MKKLVAMVVLVGVQCIALAPAFAQQSSGEGRRARTARQAPASRPGQQPVRSVSHEVIHEGVILEDDYIADSMQAANFGAAGCDSCGGGGCSTCDTGGGLCRTCHTPPRFCICFPAHGWVQAEYLGWVQSGSRVPTLGHHECSWNECGSRLACWGEREPASCLAMTNTLTARLPDTEFALAGGCLPFRAGVSRANP